MVIEPFGRKNEGVSAPVVIDKGEDSSGYTSHTSCQGAVVSPVRWVVEEPHAHRYPAHANQKAHAELLGDSHR